MAAANVSFHLPAPALREAISTYYVLQVHDPLGVADLLHPEWANVRLLVSGTWRVQFPGAEPQPVHEAAITGTLERGARVWGAQGVVVGLGILPAGWVRLTGQSADGYANRVRPLAEAFGAGANAILSALRRPGADAVAVLDHHMRALLTDRPAAPPIVAKAHAVLLDPEIGFVDAWAANLGVSPRKLERLSLRYFGLTPKRLLRRQRFLRTLSTMRGTPSGAWGSLIDGQYVDQSHFIRDFHFFLGMSPRAYFAQPQPFMREAGDRRTALMGSPVQGLHDPAAPAASPDRAG